MLERIDPWGQLREDYRNAHLIAQVANMVRGKDQKPFTPEDFLLEFKEKDSESQGEGQTPEQIEAMIKTWVAAANIMHRRELKMAEKSAAN